MNSKKIALSIKYFLLSCLLASSSFSQEGFEIVEGSSEESIKNRLDKTFAKIFLRHQQATKALQKIESVENQRDKILLLIIDSMIAEDNPGAYEVRLTVLSQTIRDLLFEACEQYHFNPQHVRINGYDRDHIVDVVCRVTQSAVIESAHVTKEDLYGTCGYFATLFGKALTTKPIARDAIVGANPLAAYPMVLGDPQIYSAVRLKGCSEWLKESHDASEQLFNLCAGGQSTSGSARDLTSSAGYFQPGVTVTNLVRYSGADFFSHADFGQAMAHISRELSQGNPIIMIGFGSGLPHYELIVGEVSVIDHVISIDYGPRVFTPGVNIVLRTKAELESHLKCTMSFEQIFLGMRNFVSASSLSNSEELISEISNELNGEDLNAKMDTYNYLVLKK